MSVEKKTERKTSYHFERQRPNRKWEASPYLYWPMDTKVAALEYFRRRRKEMTDSLDPLSWRRTYGKAQARSFLRYPYRLVRTTTTTTTTRTTIDDNTYEIHTRVKKSKPTVVKTWRGRNV